LNLSIDKYQKISIACSNDIMEAFSNYLLERNTGGLVIEDGKQNGQQILTAYLSSLKDKPFSAGEIEDFFHMNKSHFPDASYRLVALYNELDKSLTADGYIIYSGIPFDDRQRFLDFIEKKPYKIVDEISGDEWTSYIGQKK